MAEPTDSGLPLWIAQVNALALGWYTAIRAPEQLPAIQLQQSGQATGVLTTPGGSIGIGIDRSIVMILGLGLIAVVVVLLWKR